MMIRETRLVETGETKDSVPGTLDGIQPEFIGRPKKRAGWLIFHAV
jgi:hypothetical protein